LSHTLSPHFSLVNFQVGSQDFPTWSTLMAILPMCSVAGGYRCTLLHPSAILLFKEGSCLHLGYPRSIL
jgi:hypothetical protein